ncbi:hypothetical protein ACFZAU_41335 [Streptomyces sp. NPDC008238]
MLPRRGAVKGKEVDTARQLIGAMSIDWNPEDYHDTFEEKVKDLVDAKAKGQEIVGEEGPPEATNVLDLMEALQRSVDENRKRRERPSTGQGKVTRRPAGRKKDGAAKKSKSAQGRKDRLEHLSKGELYDQATKQKVPGRSKMNRDQLIDA